MIKVKLGMEVGLGPGHIVLDVDPAPPLQKREKPQSAVHVCCGQMGRWIKMSLGTEVDLGPGDIVLDGNPAPPPQKGAQQPPLFGPCLLWPNGWMDEDATWPHCVRLGSSSTPKAVYSPQFSAHVWG